jgi:hypothetical protein
MTEANVLAKLRAVLIADATIAGYVSDRVYVEHISSITDPVYPAISMALLQGQARTDVPEMVNMAIQFDLWFQADRTVDDVLACYARVRALLHRQVFTDSTVRITVLNETGIGPVLHDADSNCHHFPARYAAVAI